MSDYASALEACFLTLVAAAVAGARCPMNGVGSVDSTYTTALARAGRIKVEISGHNYRTVTILQGEHAGKHTQREPGGAKPWKIVDKAGTRRVTDFVPLYRPSSTRVPSMPRIAGESA